MARTVTIGNLVTRSLRRADMATSGFVTNPTEILDLINDEWPEVYRLLVEASPPDYFSLGQAYDPSSGGFSQALPSDFYIETTVYVTDSNGFKRPLHAVQDWALSRCVATTSAASITMEYVPAPPTITYSNPTYTPATLDGVAGWDSLLTCRVGRRLLQKRKADSGSLDAEIAQLTDHLIKGARRSSGPRYTRDVEDMMSLPYSPPYLALVSHYRIRNTAIEFYQPMVIP